jgi:hypothetical protein
MLGTNFFIEKIIHPIQLARIILANVEDEYCPLCKLPEIEQAMFFTCIQKQDLRKAVFKRYLSNPKDVNCNTVFQGLSAIKLSKYYILNYHDKFTTYDFFGYRHPIYMDSILVTIL